MIVIKQNKKPHLKPTNIGFADFETISLQNNQAYVFAIGLFFDKYYDFYINIDGDVEARDVINSNDNLISQFLTVCFNLKKNKLITIYFHNLSGFDGYFLLDFFCKRQEFKHVKVIIKDTKIFKIKYGNLQFLDSFLILNDSLNNISNTFLKKSKFDIDPNFTLTRIINEKVYILNYLKNDISILKDSFVIFYQHIWDAYSINITHCLTVSTLSFLIFLKHYYVDESIEIPQDTVYQYIQRSYYGGINEVLIPFGENLKQYDINSLYPFCMQQYKLPVKFVRWIVPGKESLNVCEFFGFLEISIFIPTYLNIGPLPIRFNGKLIFPVGELYGVFFSEEVKFALELGAVIRNIYSGAEYLGAFIFTNFVTHFFEKKNLSEGVSVYIYKLILNSLYGRFAMKRQIQGCCRVTTHEYKVYILCCSTVDILQELDDNTFIIRYNYIQNKENEKLFRFWGEFGQELLTFCKKYNSKLLNMRTCISVSAAITSYARIFMFKHLQTFDANKISVYYMDTDSVVIDQYLPSEVVGTHIGQFKLQLDNCKGIFLTSKVYILADINNSSIKKIAFKGLNYEQTSQLTWTWFVQNYLVPKTMLFNIIIKIKKVFRTFGIFTNQKLIYTTKFEMDKRVKVFDKNFKWVATRAVCFLKHKDSSFFG